MKQQRNLLSASVRNQFTDFIQKRAFKLFTTSEEKSELVSAERFKALLGKEFNRALKKHWGWFPHKTKETSLSFPSFLFWQFVSFVFANL